MGGLREKYQNDVLHGNVNMVPNDCYQFPVSLKWQYVQIYISNLYLQINVSKTLSN